MRIPLVFLIFFFAEQSFCQIDTDKLTEELRYDNGSLKRRSVINLAYTVSDTPFVLKPLRWRTSYFFDIENVDTCYVGNNRIEDRNDAPYKKIVWYEYDRTNDIVNKVMREIAYYNCQDANSPEYERIMRLKHIGKWKKNQKHGKWYYYNTNGEIIKIEKYKFGELRKRLIKRR